LQLKTWIADERCSAVNCFPFRLPQLRTPISIYPRSGRGGTRKDSAAWHEDAGEDFVSQLIVYSTILSALLYQRPSRVYWLKVYEIPDVGAAGKGKSMASLPQSATPERDCAPFWFAVGAISKHRTSSSFFRYTLRDVKTHRSKTFASNVAWQLIAIGIACYDELLCALQQTAGQIISISWPPWWIAIASPRTTSALSMAGPALLLSRRLNLAKGDYSSGLLDSRASVEKMAGGT